MEGLFGASLCAILAMVYSEGSYRSFPSQLTEKMMTSLSLKPSTIDLCDEFSFLVFFTRPQHHDPSNRVRSKFLNGALVSPIHVVTAATGADRIKKCLKAEVDVSVLVGEHGGAPGTHHDIFREMENYLDSVMADVAIVTLMKPVDLSLEHVSTIEFSKELVSVEMPLTKLGFIPIFQKLKTKDFIAGHNISTTYKFKGDESDSWDYGFDGGPVIHNGKLIAVTSCWKDDTLPTYTQIAGPDYFFSHGLTKDNVKIRSPPYTYRPEQWITDLYAPYSEGSSSSKRQKITISDD